MILGAISHAIYILVCEFELPSGPAVLKLLPWFCFWCFFHGIFVRRPAEIGTSRVNLELFYYVLISILQLRVWESYCCTAIPSPRREWFEPFGKAQRMCTFVKSKTQTEPSDDFMLFHFLISEASRSMKNVVVLHMFYSIQPLTLGINSDIK